VAGRAFTTYHIRILSEHPIRHLCSLPAYIPHPPNTCVPRTPRLSSLCLDRILLPPLRHKLPCLPSPTFTCLVGLLDHYLPLRLLPALPTRFSTVQAVNTMLHTWISLVDTCCCSSPSITALFLSFGAIYKPLHIDGLLPSTTTSRPLGSLQEGRTCQRQPWYRTEPDLDLTSYRAVSTDRGTDLLQRWEHAAYVAFMNRQGREAAHAAPS